MAGIAGTLTMLAFLMLLLSVCQSDQALFQHYYYACLSIVWQSDEATL